MADVFLAMRIPFDSSRAKELNKQIFEIMYHGALEASCELAQKLGSYESYVRNSLLLAPSHHRTVTPMPTASTSQIWASINVLNLIQATPKLP